MRAVVQRVTSCTVLVEGQECGSIGQGLLVYVAVATGDTTADVAYIVDKILHLRIFADAIGKNDLSVQDLKGQICVVSQFTLMGDVRKGRRPSWEEAAGPEDARIFYEQVCKGLAASGLTVKSGVFQAHMMVSYTNDGPITILLDSRRLF